MCQDYCEAGAVVQPWNRDIVEDISCHDRPPRLDVLGDCRYAQLLFGAWSLEFIRGQAILSPSRRPGRPSLATNTLTGDA